MDQKISVFLALLKKMTVGMDARLYSDIEAAWMSLCLLKDVRLAGKLERGADIPAQIDLAANDLTAALSRLEAACANNSEIIDIVSRIKKGIAS